MLFLIKYFHYFSSYGQKTDGFQNFNIEVYGSEIFFSEINNEVKLFWKGTIRYRFMQNFKSLSLLVKISGALEMLISNFLSL